MTQTDTPPETEPDEELQENCTDLLVASESSLDFWNNPVDDETWNEA